MRVLVGGGVAHSDSHKGIYRNCSPLSMAGPDMARQGAEYGGESWQVRKSLEYLIWYHGINALTERDTGGVDGQYTGTQLARSDQEV